MGQESGLLPHQSQMTIISPGWVRMWGGYTVGAGNHLSQPCGSHWQIVSVGCWSGWAACPRSKQRARAPVHRGLRAGGGVSETGRSCRGDGVDGCWMLLAACGGTAEQPLQSLPAMDVAGRPLPKRWVRTCPTKAFILIGSLVISSLSISTAWPKLVSKISFPR